MIGVLMLATYARPDPAPPLLCRALAGLHRFFTLLRLILLLSDLWLHNHKFTTWIYRNSSKINPTKIWPQAKPESVPLHYLEPQSHADLIYPAKLFAPNISRRPLSVTLTCNYRNQNLTNRYFHPSILYVPSIVPCVSEAKTKRRKNQGNQKS